MSFNPSKHAEKAVWTHEGGVGYQGSPEMELLLLLAGSLFAGDGYYEQDLLRRKRFYHLAQVLSHSDPWYVAALARYTRQVLGLRSGPSALVAHLFWWGPREAAEAAARGVWLRGDEHLETLAYTRAQGWKLRKALKRAVAWRLNAMSPQALLKYRRSGHAFSQRDALILTHPRPQDQAHALVYEWLARGKRALPEAQAFVARLLEERPTWERILSAEGATREAWLKALPHLRGLSLVRNLRNLHRFGLLAEEEVQELLWRKLLSPEVASWQVYPHQWLLAIFLGHQEGWPPAVLTMLEDALEGTVPPLALEGETLILVDVSGSMFQPLAWGSEVNYALEAASLGALLYRKTGGRLVGFDDRVHPVAQPPEAPLARLVAALLEAGRGGTFLGKALEESLPGFSGHRVVIFTDEQVHDDAYAPLRRWLEQNPKRSAYVINVAGYAPLAFPERGVVRMGGWSERLLEILFLLEVKDPVAWIRSGAWERTTAPVAPVEEPEDEERR
ncbi:TROVE domain-containing protein [Thermus scotoductus]|uniref:TROVE domain-containing protein n=2 Tax=Thermus scotoductus TaxID=37636 RepID=A0A430V710_THESC|nr:TROVE domain-containing protein [Thermus scotoductus]RTI02521.1 TROVE domain-containing protein [Thermus scotoductus]RTI20610.1 TROVE domain-containing protein [Thermus scotoductus]